MDIDSIGTAESKGSKRKRAGIPVPCFGIAHVIDGVFFFSFMFFFVVFVVFLFFFLFVVIVV